jgi:NitT/TauT family transport system substrate-binding protein
VPRRRRLLGALGAAGAWPWLAACGAPPPRLRLGAQVFPGYELLYLARELGQLDPELVRLVDMPSASASLRALGAGALDAACLTLDEVLAARDQGVPMTVVLVFNVSMGADVLLARPDVAGLQGLRGRRVGVEATAVGALMLDAALQAAGLPPDAVRVVPLAADEHEQAFRAGRVEALVTYDPMRQRLLALGAQTLFSSRESPGLVLDVLAVHRDRLGLQRPAVAAAVRAHLAGRQAFVAEPAVHAARLAPRLGLPVAAVPAAFAGLELPDRLRNQALLATALPEAARRLHGVMRRAGLVQAAFDGSGLVDAGFVAAAS